MAGSQRQTPMRAHRLQASPASAGNQPRFSCLQGATARDIDDSYVKPLPGHHAAAVLAAISTTGVRSWRVSAL